MANKLYREEDVRAVADAIRAKNESTETYTLSEMADAILAIESGGSVSAPLIVHSLVEDNGEFEKSNFKSITIMTESIGAQAFNGCAGLESVTLEGVKSITGWAFYECRALKSVYITDLAAWCNISFSASLSNPCNNGADLYLNGEKLTELVIPDTVTVIKPYVFLGCTSLMSITIPKGVTSIGDSAFNGCPSLTSITIPDSVTSIGEYAFESCPSLTSITIPDSVTSIGYKAFNYCDSLNEINYEGTVAEWTSLDTVGIIDREGIPVHCTDGDAVASYGSNE